MNIGIDMMGGDYAPLETVKGVQQYLAHSENNLYCIGEETQLKTLFQTHGISSPFLHIIPATEVIGYHEHPTKALKEKPNSSIAIGFKLLVTGEIDAFLSAGNTGAMLVGAMFSIKPIKGVLRPTIATLLPKLNGKTGLLVDVGLNADCKPEQLNQFGILGNLYAKHILNILAQATYPLLKENTAIKFIGNIEGRDVFNDKADVIVCDGFTGNIILKTAEAMYDAAAHQNLQNDSFFGRFHFENYGGTPVLGVNKPVIIGHGISNAKAFYNMILLAEKMIQTRFCEIITSNFENL
ncbi:MAG: phosphate acyltransferase [Chitinophagia bacterium]|nr:phosphate acyltransferase [Chitinophagia bacterium]